MNELICFLSQNYHVNIFGIDNISIIATKEELEKIDKTNNNLTLIKTNYISNTYSKGIFKILPYDNNRINY